MATASGALGLPRLGQIRGSDVWSAVLLPAGVSSLHPGAAEAAALLFLPGPLLPPLPLALPGCGVAMPSDFISLLSADLDLESPKSLYSKGECGTGPGGWGCAMSLTAGLTFLQATAGSFVRPKPPLPPPPRCWLMGRTGMLEPSLAPPAAFLAWPRWPQECILTGFCARGPAAAPARAAPRRRASPFFPDPCLPARLTSLFGGAAGAWRCRGGRR